jgi:hypothetical protein
MTIRPTHRSLYDGMQPVEPDTEAHSHTTHHDGIDIIERDLQPNDVGCGHMASISEQDGPTQACDVSRDVIAGWHVHKMCADDQCSGASGTAAGLHMDQAQSA